VLGFHKCTKACDGAVKADFLSLECKIPDIGTGFEFRQAVYAHLGVPLPPKPAKRVLLWLRAPGLGRAIINQDELIKVIESYNLSYT
jgi:hypothetical protein